MRRAAGGTDEEAARQGWGGPAVDYRGASVGGAGDAWLAGGEWGGVAWATGAATRGRAAGPATSPDTRTWPAGAPDGLPTPALPLLRYNGW
jgi:hypothetical protein